VPMIEHARPRLLISDPVSRTRLPRGLCLVRPRHAGLALHRPAARRFRRPVVRAVHVGLDRRAKRRRDAAPRQSLR
jgi:hypothetical protein